MIRTALFAAALLLGLSGCYGGGSTYGPGFDLSGRHSPYLSLGGGGPSSSTNRGGGGAETLP